MFHIGSCILLTWGDEKMKSLLRRRLEALRAGKISSSRERYAGVIATGLPYPIHETSRPPFSFSASPYPTRLLI